MQVASGRNPVVLAAREEVALVGTAESVEMAAKTPLVGRPGLAAAVVAEAVLVLLTSGTSTELNATGAAAAAVLGF